MVSREKWSPSPDDFISGDIGDEKIAFRDTLKFKEQHGFERGKNVHITATFSRHEEPGKTPEGMSADFLTDRGKQRAKERGTAEISHEFVMTTGSKAVERARETGALEKEGMVDLSNIDRVVNRQFTDRLAQAGHKKFGERGGHVIYRNPDLDPVKGLKNMWLEAGQKAAKAIGRGEITADQKETFQYEYFLNNPDHAEELGSQTPREAAQDVAHRVSQTLQMSSRLYEGMDLDNRNYTHGPKPECALKFILRQPDGKVGYDKLEEIGGPFKPGESFSLDIQRDKNGELLPVGIKRGDKKLGSLDMEMVKTLTEEYRSREKK